MQGKMLVGLAVAFVLLVGAIFVSAEVNQAGDTGEEPVMEPAYECGSGCGEPGANCGCGGSCKVKTCGCGR